MTKALILLLILFVSYSTSTYSYNQTFYLPLSDNITAIAMSRTPIINKNQVVIDLAVAINNGSVLITGSVDVNFQYLPVRYMSGPILWMDWTQAGIFMATQQVAQVVDPYDGIIHNFITPSEFINNAVVGYRYYERIILIALSLSNRIQIYQNTQLIMNISTGTGKKAMCFDETGKYFYYISLNYRYVIDLIGRYVYYKTYSGMNHISLAASTKPGYEDITASVSQSGTVVVWDDYSQLYSYTSYSKMVIFSENSEYLITASSNSLQLRSTSFSNYIGYWNTVQTIQLTSSILAMVAKNNKLIMIPQLYNKSNQIEIYIRDYGSFGVILFIIIGIASVAILIGVGQFIKARCQRNNVNQYNKFNDQGFNDNPNQQSPYNQSYPQQYNQPQYYQPPYQQPYNQSYNQPFNQPTNQPFNQPVKGPTDAKNQNPYVVS